MTTIEQELTNVTMAASAQKVAVAVKRRGRPKAQPVSTCQVLDTIEEVKEDSQNPKMYPDFWILVKQNQKQWISVKYWKKTVI